MMTFGLTYILPSNPAEQLAESMGAGHDREVIAKIEEKYGLNKSFGEQYMKLAEGCVTWRFRNVGKICTAGLPGIRKKAPQYG